MIFGVGVRLVYEFHCSVLVLVSDMQIACWCLCRYRICVSIFCVWVSVEYGYRFLKFVLVSYIDIDFGVCVSIEYVFRYFVFGLVSNMDIDF